MASNYTENYGLCQWEATDSFVRTEFNQDNARIDAALGRVEDLAASAGRNVAELLLQQYYEEKETGWKQALVFDGFQDQQLIASMTAGVLRGSQGVSLSAAGQGNVELGCTATNNSLANRPQTKTCTATGGGRITGFRFYTALVGVPAGNFTVSWTLFVNGVQARQGSASLYMPLGKTEQTLTIPATPLAKGDAFSLQLYATTGGCFSYTGDGGGGQCGTFLITPVSAESGSLTTPALALPDRGLIRAWARYRGGSVGLSVASGGSVWPLALTGTRSTVNAQGEACSEAAFRGAGSFPESGNLAFRLDLDPGADAVAVFDYGILLA